MIRTNIFSELFLISRLTAISCVQGKFSVRKKSIARNKLTLTYSCNRCMRTNCN